MRISAYIALLSLLFVACQGEKTGKANPVQIAFLADVHLQDIQAAFMDTDYQGIRHPETGEFFTIRTMGAQLRSTRLFNENYFAFLSALDDLAAKKIKLVVLPGDFSDDGQPINIKALKKILNTYSEKYCMRFFLTTGNHDPVRPFSEKGGKQDFLGKDGQNQSILSDSSLIQKDTEALSQILTKDIQKWGYHEITNELADFGFFPKKTNGYWETPFSTYTYDEYNWAQAMKESGLSNRTYEMSNTTIAVPDVSYLVEPVEGIWLLALDANVYLATENDFGKVEFSGAGIGYNNVIEHKKHLVPWVTNVVAEAKKRNKALIAFSHYPLVEFYDGASHEIRALFGEGKVQSYRIPKDEVSKVFADTGLQIHFGGHMHLNDTGVFTSKKGNTLFNFQVPSLAAYPAAYKILTVHNAQEMEIKTVSLNTLTDFKTLFPLYRNEYRYVSNLDKDKVWDSTILNSSNYGEFTHKHLEELVRIRFLTNDWPNGFRDTLMAQKGRDLLLRNVLEHDFEESELKVFDQWTGYDMIQDFYRLKNADELAKSKIDDERLQQYIMVCENLMRIEKDSEWYLWGTIFHNLMNGHPSNHFSINLDDNTLKRM